MPGERSFCRSVRRRRGAGARRDYLAVSFSQSDDAQHPVAARQVLPGVAMI